MAEVLAVVDDLFFSAKILETARRLGVPLSLIRSPEELITQARAYTPRLVIFDLNAEACQPMEGIRRLRADPALHSLATLGFFSHVQQDLKTTAAEAGCGRLLARSAFAAQLPEILRPYAAP